MFAGIAITGVVITGIIGITGVVIITVVTGADRSVGDIVSLQGFDAIRDRSLARFDDPLRDHCGLIEML